MKRGVAKYATRKRNAVGDVKAPRRRGFEQPASGEFTVPGTAIRIVLAEVFAELDEMMTQG